MSFEDQIKKALQTEHEGAEPFPGHEERFEMRLLQKQKNKVRQLPRWPWMVLAAAVMIGVVVTIVVREMKKSEQIAAVGLETQLSPEVLAAEKYYKEHANLDLNQLNASDERIALFLKDLKKLEEEYKKLENVLAGDYNNERVAKAMVENYQFRLRLMEQLRKYIEIQNNIKRQNNEQQLAS